METSQLILWILSIFSGLILLAVSIIFNRWSNVMDGIVLRLTAVEKQAALIEAGLGQEIKHLTITIEKLNQNFEKLENKLFEK